MKKTIWIMLAILLIGCSAKKDSTQDTEIIQQSNTENITYNSIDVEKNEDTVQISNNSLKFTYESTIDGNGILNRTYAFINGKIQSVIINEQEQSYFERDTIEPGFKEVINIPLDSSMNGNSNLEFIDTFLPKLPDDTIYPFLYNFSRSLDLEVTINSNNIIKKEFSALKVDSSKPYPNELIDLYNSLDELVKQVDTKPMVRFANENNPIYKGNIINISKSDGIQIQYFAKNGSSAYLYIAVNGEIIKIEDQYDAIEVEGVKDNMVTYDLTELLEVGDIVSCFVFTIGNPEYQMLTSGTVNYIVVD